MVIGRTPLLASPKNSRNSVSFAGLGILMNNVQGLRGGRLDVGVRIPVLSVAGDPGTSESPVSFAALSAAGVLGLPNALPFWTDADSFESVPVSDNLSLLSNLSRLSRFLSFLNLSLSEGALEAVSLPLRGSGVGVAFPDATVDCIMGGVGALEAFADLTGGTEGFDIGLVA